ncbi:Hpt domain-containing protein [Afifella sp. IM 167]|uniref:Hpt domain-containing protein n=1 Tax=Afifella sp. IM 167 TaxID=2033586 RepID=UPI001CCDF85A|nr:Hpt domain-containing protein [Afifella sp. IM 167]MBZ8134734.1 phosphorelay protein [Afifella sp. IM 167]
MSADGKALILNEAHLARQTMGDAELQREILSLFVAEAERLLRQVHEAKDPVKRAERVHALKGLARNVGAERLALAASDAQAEAARPEGDLSDLGMAVEEVIAHLLGR